MSAKTNTIGFSHAAVQGRILHTLGAAGFAAAAGFDVVSFLASFTGPEEPIKKVLVSIWSHIEMSLRTMTCSKGPQFRSRATELNQSS